MHSPRSTVSDAALDFAARLGVVLIDISADAFDTGVTLVREEIARDLAVLAEALAVVRLGINTALTRETWTAEIAQLASEYDQANLEELAIVLEEKIASLENIDGELGDLSAGTPSE